MSNECEKDRNEHVDNHLEKFYDNNIILHMPAYDLKFHDFSMVSTSSKSIENDHIIMHSINMKRKICHGSIFNDEDKDDDLSQLIGSYEPLISYNCISIE